MKLYEINNPNRFLRKVSECEGNVYYLDGTGKYQDMKKLANQLIAASGVVNLGSFRSLDIRMDNTKDSLVMLEYLMQSNAV